MASTTSPRWQRCTQRTQRSCFPVPPLPVATRSRGCGAAWFDAFPDVASQTHRVWTAADGFALEWTERGTHNGEFVVAGMRIPATGRRLEWTSVSCYEMADGEIRAVRYYIDPAPLMRVLGAA